MPFFYRDKMELFYVESEMVGYTPHLIAYDRDIFGELGFPLTINNKLKTIEFYNNRCNSYLNCDNCNKNTCNICLISNDLRNKTLKQELDNYMIIDLSNIVLSYISDNTEEGYLSCGRLVHKQCLIDKLLKNNSFNCPCCISPKKDYLTIISIGIFLLPFIKALIYDI